MRKLFADYYSPTKEYFDSLWENAFFGFDTNLLLDLYSVSPRAIEDYFSLLGRPKERTWRARSSESRRSGRPLRNAG